MDFSNKTRQTFAGPSAGDVLRLWTTLTTEYIPELRIVLRPFMTADALPAFYLELSNDSVWVDGHSPAVYEDVWASKEFKNPLHLISVAQLFDLLIVGYREIEAFFEHGEARAPARRPKP